MSNRMVNAKTKPAALQRNPSSAILSQFLNGDAEDRLAKALHSPDTRIVKPDIAETEATASVTVLPTKAPEPVVAAQPVIQEPVIQPITELPPPQVPPPSAVIPETVARGVDAPIDAIADEASLAIPEKPVGAARKHRRYGNRGTANQAVDMTMSLDPGHASRLTELAAYEMLRTKTRVSVSEVVRHLLDYALSNVKDNKVIPMSDGSGLHARSNGG